MGVVARELYQSLRGDDPYIQVVGVVQQAFRTWAGAPASAHNPNSPVTHPRPPVDPSIPSGGHEYRARVLVTATMPDGTTRTTIVPVDFSGPMTPNQIVAAATAALSQTQGLLLPPPGFPGGGQGVIFSGTIYTIGRQSPSP